ncbi:MAG: hypothetical protein J5808_07350 [Paludibacteraceae bacterium]|nr:hypothetical protein [Paludibacteraceae bacterium]
MTTRTLNRSVCLAATLLVGMLSFAEDAFVTVDSTHIGDITIEYVDVPVIDTTAAVAPATSEDYGYRKSYDPDKAAWYAAVFPGLGQIYNRQYWKLPIVYGGAVGLGYAVAWNNRRYVDYHKAYIDITDTDPSTDSYKYLFPEGTDFSQNADYCKRQLKTKQDTYRRYRDLSIVCVGVLYLVSILDAFVDAQMHNYDVGDDLSMKLGPAVLPPSQNNEISASVGIRCKISF